MGARGRASFNIDLGTETRPLVASALVDSGAAKSVIRRDLARQYFERRGRSFILKPMTARLCSGTGHEMEAAGVMEIHVPRVGLIDLIVVDNCIHDCIIGWDMLTRHGFMLSDEEFHWGEAEFAHEPYSTPRLPISSLESQGQGRYKVQLQKLFKKFQKIFGAPGTLDAARVDPMEINTEGQPVHQLPYKIPHKKRHLADEEIDKMLKMGIIRPSSSPWSSPILLVPKKDGSVRFCVDYRKVNSVTVKDRWPLPRVQDIFDQMGGASVFSTMDMRSGYWQVPLAPKDIQKTAFVCHRGMFEFVRVPFGLCNAPSHYQRVMTQVLGKYIGKFVHVFLDDVVVYSANEEEHLKHLELVFEALAEAGLTLKESKCTFFQEEVELLGFIVGKRGLRAQPQKTEAIMRQPDPKDVPELRRFMGMASYYRTLVPDFARTAEPLHKLVRKNVEWEWGEDQKNAFQQLKKELASKRVMAYPDLNRPYILYTDACDYAIGAILCQEDNKGLERPIQYVSAQLNNTQRRWATIEKEAYAVIYALKKLRTYLLGAEVTVYTDHKPLKCLFTSVVENTKIQRWAVLLAEYGAQIRYRPGENNVRADMLSRIPEGQLTEDLVPGACENPPAVVDVSVIDMSTEWVVPEDDPDNGKIVLPDALEHAEVAQHQQTEFPDEWEAAEFKEQGYSLREGMLFSSRRTNRYEPLYPRLVLPTQYRQEVLQRCHQEAGHAGAVKTMLKVQDHYVWPRMRTDVDEFYAGCPVCQVHIARPDRPEMGDMPVATSPGQVWSMDLIGPLPTSERGYKYCLVMLDHYSGWPEVYPLKNKSNAEVWRNLRIDFVPRHGAPRILISDQGTEFKGRGFDEWLIGNRIDHRRISPYHPQTNGKVERLNRTFKEMLRKLVNADTIRWEDEIGTALWAIRTNVSSVTGYSPFLLQYARPGRAPVQDMLDPDDTFDLENRLARQSELFQKARAATEASREYNRRRINEKATAGDIRPGDHVLKKAQNTLPFTAQWDHIYMVTAVNGLSLDLIHPETGRVSRAHRANVKLVDPDLPWEDIPVRPRRTRRAPAMPAVVLEAQGVGQARLPQLVAPFAPGADGVNVMAPTGSTPPAGHSDNLAPENEEPSDGGADSGQPSLYTEGSSVQEETSMVPQMPTAAPPDAAEAQMTEDGSVHLTARARRALARAERRKRRERTIERELGRTSDDSGSVCRRRPKSPRDRPSPRPIRTSNSEESMDVSIPTDAIATPQKSREVMGRSESASQPSLAPSTSSLGLFKKVKQGFKRLFQKPTKHAGTETTEQSDQKPDTSDFWSAREQSDSGKPEHRVGGEGDNKGGASEKRAAEIDKHKQHEHKHRHQEQHEQEQHQEQHEKEQCRIQVQTMSPKMFANPLSFSEKSVQIEAPEPADTQGPSTKSPEVVPPPPVGAEGRLPIATAQPSAIDPDDQPATKGLRLPQPSLQLLQQEPQQRRSSRAKRPPAWRADYYTGELFDLARPPGVPETTDTSSGSGPGSPPCSKRRMIDPNWTP